MNTSAELLVKALTEKRPIVLILGQSAWVEKGSEDSVLERALMHLDRPKGPNEGWAAVMGRDPVPSSFHAWLGRLFKQRVQPGWLTTLSEVPWSAIFTSSLDPSLSQILGRGGRSPKAVLTGDGMPPAIRSRIRPPVYYLFGRSAPSDARARPPLSRSQLKQRRVNHALPLLSRVPDTATNLGLIVVEGFIPSRDWLKAKDLLAVLGSVSRHQVLWFGGRPELNPDDTEDFEAAVGSDRFLVTKERLGTVVGRLLAIGQLSAITRSDSEGSGIISFEHGRFLETNPEQRLTVGPVASIIDDAWTGFLTPLGRDAEYAAFGRFHDDVDGRRAILEGVRREFAIRRDFEVALLSQVNAAINDHESLERPILIHGQSATGKTLALARLAAKVREQQTAAVLYSIDRVPQSHEVSEFCESAERSGARATLILCDCNRDEKHYQNLLTGLQSSGRRVVVVGSRYRFASGLPEPTPSIIEAPSTLSQREQFELSKLLKRFVGYDLEINQSNAIYILAMLYRALPASRIRISQGLTAEARASEEAIRLLGKKIMVPIPQGQMPQQLIKAGLSDRFRSLLTRDQDRSLEARGAAGRIIDFVMVAGQLGCSLPVNLLMRTVTDTYGGDLSLIGQFIGELDLLRWKWADDEDSELLVLPRLRLEARLICHRRLGNPNEEIARFLDLIGAIRNIGVDCRHEILFLFDLLNRIGPNGPRGRRYSSGYVRIAEMLTRLRVRFGVFHPDLVLQESRFRRRAI